MLFCVNGLCNDLAASADRGINLDKSICLEAGERGYAVAFKDRTAIDQNRERLPRAVSYGEAKTARKIARDSSGQALYNSIQRRGFTYGRFRRGWWG